MICSLCDAKCCKEKIITITAFDMYRIVKKGHNVWDFIELRKLDLLNYDERDVLRCDEGGEGYYILTIKSHPCFFLKENKCGIYEYAPLSCKLYPFNTTGKILSYSLCPFIAKKLFEIRGVENEIGRALEREVEEHWKIVGEWNKISGSKRECIEFLIKEASKRSFKKIGNVIILK